MGCAAQRTVAAPFQGTGCTHIRGQCGWRAQWKPRSFQHRAGWAGSARIWALTYRAALNSSHASWFSPPIATEGRSDGGQRSLALPRAEASRPQRNRPMRLSSQPPEWPGASYPEQAPGAQRHASPFPNRVAAPLEGGTESYTGELRALEGPRTRRDGLRAC